MMTYLKVKESLLIVIRIYMRVNFIKMRSMEKESILTVTEIIMMVNGKKGKNMVKEFSISKTKMILTKVVSKTVRKMVRDYINSLTATYMKEILKEESNRVRDN